MERKDEEKILGVKYYFSKNKNQDFCVKKSDKGDYPVLLYKGEVIFELKRTHGRYINFIYQYEEKKQDIYKVHFFIHYTKDVDDAAMWHYIYYVNDGSYSGEMHYMKTFDNVSDAGFYDIFVSDRSLIFDPKGKGGKIYSLPCSFSDFYSVIYKNNNKDGSLNELGKVYEGENILFVTQTFPQLLNELGIQGAAEEITYGIDPDTSWEVTQIYSMRQNKFFEIEEGFSNKFKEYPIWAKKSFFHTDFGATVVFKILAPLIDDNPNLGICNKDGNINKAFVRRLIK